MTRKDFVLIAKVIKDNFEAFEKLEVHPSHWQGLLASEFSRELAKTNPQFDSYKFAVACGMKEAAYVNNKGNTVNY